MPVVRGSTATVLRVYTSLFLREAYDTENTGGNDGIPHTITSMRKPCILSNTRLSPYVRKSVTYFGRSI